MATSNQISLSHYVQTSYRPDREFIDGELRERNVGTWEHARLQALLAQWLGNHEAEWGTTGSTGQRILVSPTRVRVPDLVVMRKGHQNPMIVDPPILVIEVLSPNDTYSDTQERVQDYILMGVSTIWTIDSHHRFGEMCIGAERTESARLTVPGTLIYVDLLDLFSRID